jgi:hypothetical protein
MSANDAPPMAEGVGAEEAAAAAHEGGEAAMLAAQAIDEHASFGIDEGEVDQLERKWITWCASRSDGRGATPCARRTHGRHAERSARGGASGRRVAPPPCRPASPLST